MTAAAESAAVTKRKTSSNENQSRYREASQLHRPQRREGIPNFGGVPKGQSSTQPTAQGYEVAHASVKGASRNQDFVDLAWLKGIPRSRTKSPQHTSAVHTHTDSPNRKHNEINYTRAPRPQRVLPHQFATENIPFRNGNSSKGKISPPGATGGVYGAEAGRREGGHHQTRAWVLQVAA